MRILHVLNDLTDRGNGIVNTAVDLAIEQALKGHSVTVLSAGGGYAPLLERAGITLIALDQSRKPLQLSRALMRFGKVLLVEHPDIVHAHMRTGLLLAWVWRRFRSFRLIGHIHNVHDRSSNLMGLADCAIAVSHSVAATMTHRGISKAKLRVVLNRTLGTRRQPQLDEIQPAALNHPAIVTVAGMTSRKGIEDLVLAFDTVGSMFPSAHLYLVGDGPERALFEEQARRSPFAGRIHFEGFRAVPQAYMLSADVFVLASRCESFGLVLIEARQAGCAIIATDVDGIPEALDGGRAGLLVPSRNPPSLAEAVCRVLASDRERDCLRRRALQGVDNYRVSVMADEVEKIYQEFVGLPGFRTASDLA